MLVTSFVDNLLMPIVAMIIGEPDFRELTFTINDAVFRYGSFLTDLIAFRTLTEEGRERLKGEFGLDFV